MKHPRNIRNRIRYKFIATALGQGAFYCRDPSNVESL
jgi:hypothetical protein